MRPLLIIVMFGGIGLLAGAPALPFRVAAAPAPAATAAPGQPEGPIDASNPDDMTLRRPPSIGAQFIDQVLARYGSPAQGTGAVWVELGQHYGIDPAYALAFFIHESSAGTDPGWAGLKPGGGSTHNIGNIICAGYPSCFGRFRDYASWREGIEDWYALIDREYIARGLTTVELVIPVYAPAFENDVGNYTNVVSATVARWRRGAL